MPIAAHPSKPASFFQTGHTASMIISIAAVSLESLVCFPFPTAVVPAILQSYFAFY